MKENVLDVLVYLFQNFLDDDTAVRFDRDSMQTDLLEAGSMAAAKAAGKVRMEGKDYVMADGDVVEFRFNF